MDEVSLVLEQFVDAFYNVAFAQHHLVPQGHELVLHVRLEAMNQVDALVEQALEEFLFDVSPVRKDLAIKHFCKTFYTLGSLSSTLAGVRQKVMTSPVSLHNRCSLKP